MRGAALRSATHSHHRKLRITLGNDRDLEPERRDSLQPFHGDLSRSVAGFLAAGLPHSLRMSVGHSPRSQRRKVSSDIALATKMSAGVVVPLCRRWTVLVSVFEPYAAVPKR